MSKSRSSSNPRKFAEKIALLNKSEAETTAEFEKILKEVEETTRVPPQPHQFWCPPTRSASFSNRLASDSGRHQQQQQQHQQHQQHRHQQQQQQQQQHRHQAEHAYGYHDSNRFFGQQPAQFPPAAGNQIHQLRQQVVDDVRHQQQQVQLQQHLHHQHNHHNQQQQQQQHRGTIYAGQHHNQTNSFMQQPVASDNPNAVQSKIEVPNIEIFSIEDEYQRQPPRMQISPPISVSETQDSLTNGHYRDDCSINNSPISPTRSLPDIASLSMSSPQAISMQHPIGANQLVPPISTGHLSTSPNANSLLSNASANPADDGYHRLDSGGDWYSGEEAHSLPPIQDQSSNCASLQDHRQHQRSPSQLARVDSWQQVAAIGSAPSATPTPPYVQTSPYIDQQQHSPQQNSPQQQVVHSADSSPHRQPLSPQSLHQDQYYSLQIHSPPVRASSTTNISKYPAGDDLLETPPFSSNLSKSSDACYNYQEEFVQNGGMFCNQFGAVDNSSGRRGMNYMNSDLQYVNETNPVARSYSEKNIETNQSNHW